MLLATAASPIVLLIHDSKRHMVCSCVENVANTPSFVTIVHEKYVHVRDVLSFHTLCVRNRSRHDRYDDLDFDR